MKNEKIKERLGEVSLNVSEFIMMNERIFRGVLWAVAIVALVLSIVGLKNGSAKNKVYAKEPDQVVVAGQDNISREEIENIIFEMLSETLLNYTEELEQGQKEIVIEKSDVDIEKLQTEILTKVEDLKKTGLTAEEEAKVKELIKSTVEKVDYDKIQELIDNSKGEANNNLEATKKEINNVISESTTKIINSTSEADEYLQAQITDNKNHLLDKNGSGQEFQYGYDAKSGAYGYYVNGNFNPF